MTKTKKSAALLKVLVIAAILILLPIVTPNMYIMQIINMIGIYIILGVGINVLTGYTGQLSLGQAAFFGIGAYTAALMNTRAGLQFIPCLLGSVVVTAFFGVVLAIPALKVKGSYLALLTMGFGEVVRIVMINWTPVTNGTAGVLGIQSPVIFGFAFDTLKKYYFMQVLPEALRFLGDWRLVVYGLILLVVILRFPGGLYPYIKRFVNSHSKKQPVSAETKEG